MTWPGVERPGSAGGPSGAEQACRDDELEAHNTASHAPPQLCDPVESHEGPLPFGVSRIVTTADGRYRPDPSGDRAAIVPVRDRFGDLCDLVAWFPDRPEHWWLRFNDETPILGTQALAIAAAERGAIKLHSMPERWLVAKAPGCIQPPGACVGECDICELPRGACVLRWDVPLGELFDGVGRVICDRPELERRLLQALRRWEPRVKVARREARRAA